MNNSTQTIVQAALELAENDRAFVVQELLDSLSPDSEKILDDAWAAELDRRLADFMQSPSGAIPWPELKDQK